jgi:hypothetical protein
MVKLGRVGHGQIQGHPTDAFLPDGGNVDPNMTLLRRCMTRIRVRLESVSDLPPDHYTCRHWRQSSTRQGDPLSGHGQPGQDDGQIQGHPSDLSPHRGGYV